MTFKPPWKSPPPDLYKLKPVLGYRNHDITKKRAPAWSFVRYIPLPKPKPEVSPSPIQMMKKKFGKKKRVNDMKQGKSDFVTDGGVSKKKMQHRRKKHKNRKRTTLDESKLALSKKTPQDASSSKDKSKKVPGKLSIESDGFYVSPADMCDLCFPWMKKVGKSSADQKSGDDPKAKKIRRSHSISTDEDINAPRPHSFIVLPQPRAQGDKPAEPPCEPHSAMLFPSGRRVNLMVNAAPTKQNLPRPPLDDESTGHRIHSQKKKKPPKNLTAYG